MPWPTSTAAVWTSTSGPSASAAQAHARGRVVVEALGVADVLERDREPDAAAHALAVRGVGDPARQLALVGRAVGLGWERERSHALEQLGHRRRLRQDLPGRQAVAGRDRVADPQRHRIHPERIGEPVHLRLVSERDLDRSEPAHRSAGRVVGVDDVARERCVRHRVRSRREARRVRAHRGGAGRVGAAVEHDPRAHEHEPPVGARPVRVLHARGMAVDVAEERLVAAVDHLHRPAGAQREHARVDLHRDVLAAAERAADAAEREPHALGRQAEAGGDLVAVDVQPLRRDVQIDAAVAVRHRQPGLRAQERLVLHADLVGALDDDVGIRRRGVAVLDHDRAQEVAAVVQRRRIRRHRPLGVGHGFEHLVVDRDRGGRPARGLRVVGGDDRDRLALVADVAPGEHRLVGELEPVRLAPGHVLVREHGVDALQRERARGVERDDPSARVRAAQRRAPQHPVAAHVRGVLELAAHLRHAVGARRARPDHAGARRGGDHRSRSAASWTASTILA